MFDDNEVKFAGYENYPDFKDIVKYAFENDPRSIGGPTWDSFNDEQICNMYDALWPIYSAGLERGLTIEEGGVE
jgi:hypothetical protein